ncbi:MAG: zinc ribbon domain-containing protein [Gemmatimonadota bacterium]
MDVQLELLLQIQDLKTQRRELTEADAGREVEEEEFNVDVGEAVDDLDTTIAEMEEQLSAAIRDRYDQLSRGRGRAVVPVINGICYGCFVSIPTAVASDVASNQEIRQCDNCGRFLYVIGP